MGRPFVRIVIGLLITVFSIYLFYISVGDFRSAAGMVGRLSFFAIAAAAGLSLFALFLRALRLQIMLGNKDGVTVRSLYSIICVSFMFNNILPFRMGEVARVFLVYRKHGYPLTLSIGSLFAERVLDSLGYALLLIIPAYMLGFFSAGISLLGVVPLKPVLTAVSLGLLFGLSFLLIIVIRPAYVIYLLKKRPFGRWKIAVSVMEFIEKMVSESIAWLASPTKFFKVMLLTLVTVFCYGFTIYILIMAIDSQSNLLGSLFTSGIVAIGVSLPSAPGYAGTLELAIQSGLLLLGLSGDKAAAVAVSYHLIGWAAVVVVGLFAWLKMDISYSSLKLLHKNGRVNDTGKL